MRTDWPSSHLAKRRAGGLLTLVLQLAARGQNQQQEQAVFSKTLVRGGIPFSGMPSGRDRKGAAAEPKLASGSDSKRVTRDCYADSGARGATDPDRPGDGLSASGRSESMLASADAPDEDAASVSGRPLYDLESEGLESGFSGVFSEGSDGGSEGGGEGSDSGGPELDDPRAVPAKTLRGVRWGVNQAVVIDDPGGLSSEPPDGEVGVSRDGGTHAVPEKSARSITPQQLAKQVKSAEAAQSGAKRSKEESSSSGGVREWDKWRNPLADDEAD